MEDLTDTGPKRWVGVGSVPADEHSVLCGGLWLVPGDLVAPCFFGAVQGLVGAV